MASRHENDQVVVELRAEVERLTARVVELETKIRTAAAAMAMGARTTRYAAQNDATNWSAFYEGCAQTFDIAAARLGELLPKVTP